VRNSGADLTIGAVAARTGIPPTVLRSWQERFGFPQPRRAPSGHRRFDEADIGRILQVVQDRDAGLSLEAAIARAQRGAGERDASIVTGMRRRHPELPAHVWTKRAMLAVSRAIEDECQTAAVRPLLIGCFQQVRLFRATESRWRDLTGSRGVALVFADFGRVRRRGRVTELPGRSVGLDAEWAIVCAAPGTAAYLAGRERPGQPAGPDAARLFEASWSVEPDVVRDAAEIGLALAEAQSPAAARRGRDAFAEMAEPAATTVRRAISIANRVTDYLDSPHPRAG
jgi:DNA-binding transcriptional MerR regulator